MNDLAVREDHPSWRARLVRSLRGLSALRGWKRAASAFAGHGGGGFRVADHGVWLEGDLGSLIERQVYLYGGYERDEIALFLDRIPGDRRGTILDIGANVGTHTLRFAQAFRQVLAFEPNPRVIDRLRRNVGLNRADNVTVHQVGLADAVGELELFAPEGGNQGLGTFVTAEQYDRPLARIGSVPIVVGDDFISGRIDAIKCDVQGFEAQVLRGLAGTIARDRPVMWIEIGSGAHAAADEIATLLPLLPQPARYFRFGGKRHGLVSRAALIETTRDAIGAGDFVIVPE